MIRWVKAEILDALRTRQSRQQKPYSFTLVDAERDLSMPMYYQRFSGYLYDNTHAISSHPYLPSLCAHLRSSAERFLSTLAAKSPSEKLARRRLERRCSWEARSRVTLWYSPSGPAMSTVRLHGRVGCCIISSVFVNAWRRSCLLPCTLEAEALHGEWVCVKKTTSSR